jgi:hypothetical protein
MMDRFPGKYESPKLLSLDEGLKRGWTAACGPGNGPASGGCKVGFGPVIVEGGDGFIDPEVIQGSV